uniref:Uncharacterized protein n=1 Tax=Nelumbo nucifera TaxID=4432 RepID=A0A822XZF0_NELNU|nr:TPA_asm: hypothetical protein HUJ06_024221 [Nelumbo nucifera]
MHGIIAKLMPELKVGRLWNQKRQPALACCALRLGNINTRVGYCMPKKSGILDIFEKKIRSVIGNTHIGTWCGNGMGSNEWVTGIGLGPRPSSLDLDDDETTVLVYSHVYWQMILTFVHGSHIYFSIDGLQVMGSREAHRGADTFGFWPI